MKQATVPKRLRSRARSRAPLLLAIGLVVFSAIGLDPHCGGPPAAYGSIAATYQHAKSSSDVLGGAEAWLEAANAAGSTPIETKNNVRARHPPKATDGGGVAARKGGAAENSTFEVNVMPPWMHKKTPAVGSPEWKEEQQETERQEREVRRAIEGVCRGC